MYEIYQNTINKSRYLYVRKSDGIPANVTPGNWVLVATKRAVHAAAVEGIERDGFHMSEQKIEFNIVEGNHPAADLARKLE